MHPPRTGLIGVRNTTTQELVFNDLGITIAPLEFHCTSAIPKQNIAESMAFNQAIDDGAILVIKDLAETHGVGSPETYWDVDEAKLLVSVGINKTLIDLEKVANVLHNYNALNPPGADADSTLGYSRGSMWIMHTHTSALMIRVWVCAHPDVGAVVWSEITQPPISPGVVNDRYYGPEIHAPLVADQQYPDLLVAVPMVLSTVSEWNRIGVEVTTASVGGVARMGIYSNVNARPGNLLLDAGFFTLDTAGKKEIVIDFENPADWFWLVIVTSQYCELLSTVGDNVSKIFGLADPSYVVADTGGLVADMSYSVLPSTYPPITDEAQRPPYIWLRRV